LHQHGSSYQTTKILLGSKLQVTGCFISRQVVINHWVTIVVQMPTRVVLWPMMTLLLSSNHFITINSSLDQDFTAMMITKLH
jgi:hypothetical protein